MRIRGMRAAPAAALMSIGMALLPPAASPAVVQDATHGAALAPRPSERPQPQVHALYDRAVALEARGRFADALPLLWEAAQLAPDNAEIQNRLGEALERIGSLEAAVDAYRRAVARDGAFRKAANNLILALAKAGRAPEAVELARKAVAAAPDDPDRLYTLGLAQAEYDLNEAAGTFHRVLALAPRHSLARYNLALVLKRADRPEQAIAELREVLAIEPRPEAHYTLGVIYFQQGDLARAADALRAAVAARPAYADAHAALGSVLRAGGDLDGAASALRRAIDLDPTSSGTHYVLSQVLRSNGDQDGARKHLAESERLRQQREREHEASVLTSMGIQRLAAGDAAAAVDYFTQATAAFDAYAPAHYQMGLALQRLGKTGEARAAFARARQLHPALVPPPDLP